MRGIYKITNKINNKVYIGESLNIRKRWIEHIDDLKTNKHHSYTLQTDWNKYGQDNFEFSIVSVLDDNIEKLVDEYILLLYEYKYILKYDSINNGYNVEETLKEVIKGNKSTAYNTNNKKDLNILKQYHKHIQNNVIRDEGGIIYSDSFTMKCILSLFKMDSKEKFKGLLYNNNLILPKGGNTYILNENIFDRNNIINNESFSKIRFNSKIYYELINKINDILKSKNVNYEIVKDKSSNMNADKPITKEEKEKILLQIKTSESESELNNLSTIRNFIENHTLTTKYISVLKFLRDNGVLKHVNIDGNKTNYPTENYMDCFAFKRYINNDDRINFSLLVTEKGKKVIYDLLYNNSIIIE